MPDNKNQFSASYKLKKRGKVVVRIKLSELEQSFKDFYNEHGDDTAKYSPEVWVKHLDLLTTMCFYGHLTRFSPACGWIIEDVMGVKRAWIMMNPEDWFNFV